MLDNICKQSARLKSGSIRFKNYFRQLAVPFKIHADLACFLKEVKSIDKNNSSYIKKYQDHIPCSLAYKVVCIDNKFSKRVVIYRGKKSIYKFIETILREYDYILNNNKKAFKKKLPMSAEEEERFDLSNICWICNKLFGYVINYKRSLSYNRKLWRFSTLEL